MYTNISAEHPLYTKYKGQWSLIRDCVAGDDAIKGGGTKYLPKLCRPTRDEEDAIYRSYQARAFWVNFTGQALENIHGMIMRRHPTIDAPDLFKKSGILESIDGRGTSLYQFASDVMYDTIQTCFGGVLVDMPNAPDGMTLAEAEERGIRPYLRYYRAEDLINWREGDGHKGEMRLVVLRETYDDGSDMFVHTQRERFRLLMLDEEGYYVQRLVTVSKDRRGRDVWEEERIDVRVNGERLRYIPFMPLPYNLPEKTMLYDMAKINIGHFQKTADYENAVHKTTLPTGWITGHKALDENGEQEQIILGDDTFLTIEEPEAKVGTLVFSGEGLLHSETAIKRAEEQMAVIGTRIIAPEKNVAETAESGMVHMYGENGKMATFARNMGERMSVALTWMMNWCGYEGKARLDFDVDYETVRMDPNAINAIANLSRENKFPLLCTFQVLQEQGYVDINYTYEDFIYLLELEGQGLTPLEVYDSFKSMRDRTSRMLPRG